MNIIKSGRWLCASVFVVGCNQAVAPPVAQAPVETVAVVVAVKPDMPENPANKVEPPVAVMPPAKEKPFAFPKDAGGEWVAKVVTPAVPPALPAAQPVTPRERILPAYLDGSPSLAEPASAPPLLKNADLKTPLPTPLPDRVPVELAPPMPLLPDRQPLPTHPLTRDERPDVSLPVLLPTLSPVPVPERASLADPTTEFTAQSVISVVLPLRLEPTGFLRLNLPDPFETRGQRSTTVLPDEPNRALGNPPPPKP